MDRHIAITITRASIASLGQKAECGHLNQAHIIKNEKENKNKKLKQTHASANLVQ